jgi:hypothetical protein
MHLKLKWFYYFLFSHFNSTFYYVFSFWSYTRKGRTVSRDSLARFPSFYFSALMNIRQEKETHARRKTPETLLLCVTFTLLVFLFFAFLCMLQSHTSTVLEEGVQEILGALLHVPRCWFWAEKTVAVLAQYELLKRIASKLLEKRGGRDTHKHTTV